MINQLELWQEPEVTSLPYKMPKFLWAIVFVLYHGKVKRFGQQLARVLLCNVGLDDAHSSILVI